MTSERMVIIGAGPVGLETALRGVRAGFDVTVLEQGQVGQAIQNWGHVQFFTPFSMNSSSAGREAASTVATLPDHDAILSGAEYCRQYLAPLLQCDELIGRVRERHKLLAVSRMTLGKTDEIGKAVRARQPFRMLVESTEGQGVCFAEILIDCTGFTGKHRWMGAGGIPCPGESQLLSSDVYSIPNVAGAQRDRFAGKTIAVIGSGYSAATTVVALASMQGTESANRICWITRADSPQPIMEVPADPLAQRRSLVEQANSLALNEGTVVKWMPGPVVERLAASDEQFQLQLRWPREGRAEVLVVDHIIANTGYRPDTSPFEELQIHRCYATDGPIRMAAHLLGESSGDCLNQSTGDASLLTSPEPDFFTLGAASYGRDSRFLLQNGLQQIDVLFNEVLNHRHQNLEIAPGANL